MQKHLNDLSRKLTAHRWQIAEHEGNELDISAVWLLRHPAAPAPPFGWYLKAWAI
jgi:hypothetical protein